MENLHIQYDKVLAQQAQSPGFIPITGKGGGGCSSFTLKSFKVWKTGFIKTGLIFGSSINTIMPNTMCKFRYGRVAVNKVIQQVFLLNFRKTWYTTFSSLIWQWQ